MNKSSDLKPSTVNVDLGERSYDIIIGAGLLKNAGHYIGPLLKSNRLAIITDEVIAPLHLETLKEGLGALEKDIDVFILPAGEGEKSFSRLETLLKSLLDLNYGRDDTLLAFGGGVIGDLVGFTASILKRGCRFIQIPTTLLAQVDSSVGGKTAINTPAGKNLVGCFYQPKLVLADMDVLSTLPARQLKAGYAEVIKYGLIDDLDFWSWLEDNGADVLSLQPEAIAYAVATSCKAKARIVAQDETERGKRALLNLGHTFAHALEGVAGYDGSLLHGEAVSAGLLMAYEFSEACPDADTERVARHLRSADMMIWDTLSPSITKDGESLFQFMMRDKKNKAANLTLILSRGIGQAYIESGADQDMVLRYLNEKCE